VKADPLTAASLLAMPADQRGRLLGTAREADAAAMLRDSAFWARPEQLPPSGEDWRVWLMLAGRGFGKTRAGAEWVRGIAEADGAARIALVGATMAEARAVMVEGESGLLAIAPDDRRPLWEPSLRRLSWPSGAMATLYSASEPEGLRGPQHSHGWCDEIAEWAHGMATWSNLALGMRLGERPRIVATTTPRPVPLVRALVGRHDVRTMGGRSADNRANLPPDFLAAVEEAYGGTRFGRQELDGELIEKAEGALWTRALIEQCRVRVAPDPVRGGRRRSAGGQRAGVGRVRWRRPPHVTAPGGWSPRRTMAARWWRACCARPMPGYRCGWSMRARARRRGPSRWRRSTPRGGCGMSALFPRSRIRWRGCWRAGATPAPAARRIAPTRWSGR